MLSSLERLRNLLSIPLTDASQNEALQQALNAAVDVVRRYCKRELTYAVRTEYPRPTNLPDQWLRERPVWMHSLSCALTSGSALATGLSSTSALAVGMPAVHPSLPGTAVISALTSATSVTLSAAATATNASALVSFGLAVYLDPDGFAGQKEGGFPATSILYPGIDFMLDLDGSTPGMSRSGLLRRMAGSSAQPWSHDFPWGWRRGTLTARLAPAWPGNPGSLKVVYASGYKEDAVPEDLMQAVDQVAVWLWKYGPTGGLVLGSEGYEGYNYAMQAISNEPFLGSTRQILSRYRDVSN